MEIDALLKQANNKFSWRDRKDAAEKMKELSCQQSKDKLINLALHDPVFAVREAAFRAAQARKLLYKGKQIFLGKKPKGDLVKDIQKKLIIVRRSFQEEPSLDDFKRKFFEKYPIEYDCYDGDKQERFECRIDFPSPLRMPCEQARRFYLHRHFAQ